ncbi:M1 family metallopeptidase [Stackebrandtia nassauensis]|uniref:Aminopeptidase N n=1 Tax=Stackebrandtia nassauensis (strain DSM 44728 / CIP 108903 / NRRL B-16338 / NBRC 102104 / LLR-40K-21) TaxID=446470 RepID=D3Q6N7_STANL|nr:M1 family metallopeptidase [Stackebrandtia nassauensis]ADD44280.1 Peptidase M1 membrane alanine aminopeptidase [Stackebrandtia nassauensis DSM 44728]
MNPRLGVIAVAGVTTAVLVAGCGQTGKLESESSDGPPEAAKEDLEAGKSEPVTDPMYPDYGHENIDVLHYGMELDYSPEKKTLSGLVRLTIRPVEDASELALDFSDAMEISNLTVDGKKTDFDLNEWDLTVDTGLKKDRNVEVEVTYKGTPELVDAPAERGDMAEGLGASVGQNGELWAFQEPHGALTWYPVNDHPSDEAMYDFEVTVPEGYAGVASGTFEGKKGNTYSWSSSDPVASYLTTIAVDKYEMVEMEGPGDLPVTAWIPPQYAEWEASLKKMPEMIEYLEKLYGPYPFDSAGLVLVGGESGMETQQMITLSGAVGMGGPEASESVVVHELAHQWFGDTVTPLDWTGLWINEGPATYAEQMWLVDQGMQTAKDVEKAFEAQDQDLRTQHGPPGDPDPNAFASSNSYVCPALMLIKLGDQIGGRDKVDELLGAWVAAHENKSVTREDFVGFANEHTGKDLTKFFDSWLDSAKTPKDKKDKKKK